MPRDGTGVAALAGGAVSDDGGESESGMIEYGGAACVHGKRLSTIGFSRFKRDAHARIQGALKLPSDIMRSKASGMMLAYRLRYVSDYKTSA